MRKFVRFLSMVLIFSLIFSGLTVDAKKKKNKKNKSETTTEASTESSTTESEESDSDNSSGETLVSYAMQWNENPNINYVYGGPGRSHTLEDCDKDKLGTDCSGFCSGILKHFGIISEGSCWSSNTFNSGSNVVKSTKKMEEAEPGYFAWYSGHIALYIGDGKIIHTNTSQPNPSSPKMPTNYIHISKLGDYRMPQKFVLIKGTEDLLGKGSGSNNKSKEIEDAKSVGSALTDSDLTGMPIPSTLQQHQEMIELYGDDDLSLVDGNSLNTIRENIDNRHTKITTYFNAISVFLGFICMIYATVIMIAAVFDLLNSWIDISLLEKLSFNKWKIVSKAEVAEGTIKTGYSKTQNKTYLTMKLLIFRIALIFTVGAVLVSGVLVNAMTKFVLWFNK